MSAAAVVSPTAPRFLRIPPFPGAQFAEFEVAATDAATPRDDPQFLCELIRNARVGGEYWGGRPTLPDRCLLCRDPARLADCRAAAHGASILLWADEGGSRDNDIVTVRGACDPWHMLQGASMLVCRPHDPARTVAALLGVPVDCDGEPRIEAPTAFIAELSSTTLKNPFTGEEMGVREAVELCGFWRRLIDSNRGLAGGFGFAFWKKEAVAPLLWSGSTPFAFFTTIEEARGDAPSPVAVWRARTSPSILAELENSGVPLVEVEDGFLRSRGLGADCVPPLSIVVDRLGPHFDPRGESELEQLLQDGEFSDATLDRAAALRQAIVKAGLGKYEAGGEPIERFVAGRRHILVPGQVEDDQSVLAGGAGLTSNLELLKRVRATAPDAYIIYKPHPDVVAGHRKGAVAPVDAFHHADRIVVDAPIAALVDMVDEVHVNTSLTGFEALLRNKAVTTHGVPFYAGWGLTTDLGPVPERRTRRRSVEELVAAALLLYPRYLDPVTGLPCPAEVAVHRLTSAGDQSDLLIMLRRFQGRVMKRLRSMRR